MTTNSFIENTASYPNEFRELVAYAIERSENTYNDYRRRFPISDDLFSVKEYIDDNPFYIGYGNPKSEILIVGKEKAIDKKKNNELFLVESVTNPLQWELLMRDPNSDITKKYFQRDEVENYFNPRRPFIKKFKGKGFSRHTYNAYQKLAELIYKASGNAENINTVSGNEIYSFFEHTFITEINHKSAKRTSNLQATEERKKFLAMDFYKKFPVIIVAAGSSFTQGDMKIFGFDDYEIEDRTTPYNRLVVFKDKKQKRVLISTRQLSNSFKGNLLDNIADVACQNLHSREQ